MMFSVAFALTMQISLLTFKGGSDHDLVDFLARTEKVSIALLADPGRRWSKRTFEYKDELERKKLILNYCSGHQDGEWIASSSSSYALSTCLTQNRYILPRAYTSNKIEVSKKKGLISVKSPGGPVPLTQLLSIELSHHVEWHWYFEGLYLDVNVKNLSEPEFLALIAKALGAKVVTEKSKYVFDFDSSEFRKRASKGLSEAAKLEPKRGGRRAAFLFTAEVLRLADNSSIELAYEKRDQDKENELALNSNNLRQLAIEKLKSQFPIENDGVKRSPADYEMWQRIGPFIDTSKPPKAIISSNGIATAVFYGEKDGKPFRIVL